MRLRKIIVLLATIVGLSIVVFNNLNQMTDFLKNNNIYVWWLLSEMVLVSVYVLYNNKLIFKKH